MGSTRTMSSMHILTIAAYLAGILTSVFWHWASSTASSPIKPKLDPLSTKFNQNSTFTKMQSIQPITSKMSYEQQNNIIMSSATNMDTHDLHRFIRSARSTCNNCTIVLIMDNKTSQSNNTRLLVDVFKVSLIIWEDTMPKYNNTAFHITGVWNKRWIIFHDYLQTLEAQGITFDNMFFCDLRDSIFQTNVFAHMNARGDGLYAFIEDVTFTIGTQHMNGEWIKACYGDQMYQSMSKKSISCSGTVLGSRLAVIAYLSTMKTQILSQGRGCLEYVGSDQGIHNYIVHNAIIPNTTVYQIPHETGFVGTVGLPTWLKRNKVGLVLNANKSIYAVVHQLNRSPQLLSQYGHEYQLLPDDVLDKKS